MDTNVLQKVDHAALKTNQAVIIILSIIAFILNLPVLAAFVGLVMLAGTLRKGPGFGFIYRLLNSAGWIKPDVLPDNPAPHRFAQGFGAFVLLAGWVSLFAGLTALGWGLVWLVISLAALNLFAGFCVGCAVYFWLGKINTPGFTQSPPEGTFPGMRPNGN